MSKGSSAMVFGVSPPAQDLCLGKVLLSMITTLFPASRKMFAAIDPAGPAPIITMSVLMSIFSATFHLVENNQKNKFVSLKTNSEMTIFQTFLIFIFRNIFEDYQ